MKSPQVAPGEVVEKMVGEWKRSMLVFWTLSLLMTDEMYGLAIVAEIDRATQGKLRPGTSTIYQLLRRLEKRGLIESRWERSSQGPPRAYYRATAAGREVVARFVSDVLAPDSPIAAGMNELMSRVMRLMAQGRP